jgi:three-Cys-motif partner protein
MRQYADENPEYWEDYNNLQRVKHELLKRYLGGWFPILGSWSGRIIYIDCHAGRGKHNTGQKGSPLVALEVLLNHSSRPRILKNCQIRFYFIEADPENKKILEENLVTYEKPSNVFVKVERADFQEALQELVDRLDERGTDLAPAFVFVDPYGFKLPGQLLARLKSFERCELFITFMWRWVDMAIRNPSQEENMDALFGSPEWRELRDLSDPDERCEAAIRLLDRQIGGKYLTRVKMLGEHGEIKYVLIHTTGHPKGRELMLEAMWKICPTGGFRVRVNDNPDQEFLIEPTPDLEPLRDWLWRNYSGKSVSVEQIYSDLEAPETGTFYLKRHLHLVLKELHGTGEITGPKKLVFTKDPTIRFRAKSSNRSEER